MEIKTNAMRLLDKQKAVYRSYRYDSAVALSGIEVATVLGQKSETSVQNFGHRWQIAAKLCVYDPGCRRVGFEKSRRGCR